MKAVIQTRSGPPDVLRVVDIEKPASKENEILVRVHAASVTSGDVILRKIHPLFFILLRAFGLRRKRTPGHEFAGIIEAIGPKVSRFAVGDSVFGTTTGLSAGANAEYLCVPEQWKGGVVTAKPAIVPYEEAAVVPVGGMTALHLLQKAGIRQGQEALIYGASGSVGVYAVQLAKHFGARVTAVCSGPNQDLARSLGADETLDYTSKDFSLAQETYDVVFDAVGKLATPQAKAALKKTGKFISVKSPTSEGLDKLNFLAGLLGTGELKAVIDRHYPLEQIAEAHRYVESGHKRGNVVIRVAA